MQNPTKNDFPIHDLLRTRWSPRAFDAKAVEPAKVKSLLEAARWAPSSYNEQPWAFLIATKAQPAEHAKLLECLIEFNQSWAKAAPLLIITVAHTSFAMNAKPNRHAFHDVGLAMANLTIQATAEGLVVHQMAGILPDKVRELYAVPADWDAVTGVAIGYPGDPATLNDALREKELAERTRKPQASFVFSGSWGKAVSL
ncbi:MAG: nitroreductase family protein [Planctomycetes bacterium]|nr:nitroreductase family protein [Planctomycetota bacterium]